MTLRSVLMLLVALILAWVAYFAANRWMASRMATGGGTDLTQVVAAASDIPMGTRIDATMIRKVPLPTASIPAKAFRDEKDVIGRFADHAIDKGDFLVDGLVVERVGGSTLAATIEAGKRAVTVRSNDVIGVAGFLAPGNRVDMIATRRTPGGIESRTLLENLKVLAVDQTKSPDKNDPLIGRAVTLEVDPLQAEQIARATEEGNVQLTLRNPLDGIRHRPAAAAAPPAVAVAPAATRPVERSGVVAVIRGTKPDAITLEPLRALLPSAPEGQEPPTGPQ